MFANYWVLTQLPSQVLITYHPITDFLNNWLIDNYLILNFQNLITYLDDPIIIQIGY
jgi:hypothetical protein